MRATEANLLLITRILALAFAGFSTFFSLVALGGFRQRSLLLKGRQSSRYLLWPERVLGWVGVAPICIQ